MTLLGFSARKLDGSAWVFEPPAITAPATPGVAASATVQQAVG